MPFSPLSNITFCQLSCSVNHVCSCLSSSLQLMKLFSSICGAWFSCTVYQSCSWGWWSKEEKGVIHCNITEILSVVVFNAVNIYLQVDIIVNILNFRLIWHWFIIIKMSHSCSTWTACFRRLYMHHGLYFDISNVVTTRVSLHGI